MIKNFFLELSTEEGNAYRYRIIYIFCLVIHSFYAILFGCVGVTGLMYFNIASSLMYFTGMIIVRNNRMTILWLCLLSAEIIAHGLLCSIYVGYSYQFTLFSLAIIPVSYFLSYLDPAFKHPVIVSSVLAFINSMSIISSLDYSRAFDPVYNTFPREFVNSIARLNLTIAILILVSFSIMFIGKINNDLKTLKSQNAKLDFLANYDQLTGLRNRNHIRDIFGQYIESTEPYCVILGDIDDFKHVNDTYGHAAGDDVLRKVSEIITKNVGDKGVVCRWGGEEILIIVKGGTDECIDLNEKILREIRRTTVISGKFHINVTMTFGLCDYGDAMDIERLISLADKRLYIGKNSGKNKVVSES